MPTSLLWRFFQKSHWSHKSMFFKSQSQCIHTMDYKSGWQDLCFGLTLWLCRSWIRPRRSPPLRATFSSSLKHCSMQAEWSNDVVDSKATEAALLSSAAATLDNMESSIWSNISFFLRRRSDKLWHWESVTTLPSIFYIPSNVAASRILLQNSFIRELNECLKCNDLWRDKWRCRLHLVNALYAELKWSCWYVDH